MSLLRRLYTWITSNSYQENLAAIEHENIVRAAWCSNMAQQGFVEYRMQRPPSYTLAEWRRYEWDGASVCCFEDQLPDETSTTGLYWRAFNGINTIHPVFLGPRS
jgi:hypothetical protein